MNAVNIPMALLPPPTQAMIYMILRVPETKYSSLEELEETFQAQYG